MVGRYRAREIEIEREIALLSRNTNSKTSVFSLGLQQKRKRKTVLLNKKGYPSPKYGSLYPLASGRKNQNLNSISNLRTGNEHVRGFIKRHSA